MTIRVDVRYFAAVRERLSSDGEPLMLQAGDTVNELWTALTSRHPTLTKLRPHLRVAVNGEFASDDQPLQTGDEVALIPPVAGGTDRARITDEPLDAPAIIERVRRDSDGAVVHFTGVVRDHNEGKAVSQLEYETYPEMAVAKLDQIIDEIGERWSDCAVVVTHRVGKLAVGDVAVVIAVASPHRKEAFDACQYMIDRIKQIVPIWKREVGPDGVQWVGLDDDDTVEDG